MQKALDIISKRTVMKRIQYFLLFVSCLQSVHLLGFGKKTFFDTRSQGLDSVSDIVGWQKLIYRDDKEQNYGTYAASIKYSRSFRSDKIANFLFGGESLHFTGSAVANRASTDILADYFGLPRDFNSMVCFTPRVTNVVVDLSWFHDFEKHVPGLYVIVYAPITHTKWDLNMNEAVMQSGTAFFPAGYMGDARIVRTALPANATIAWQGKTIFGDMQEPLEFGKIFGRQTKNRVAELQATLGWNYNRSWYHLGVYGRVGAPTGNASAAEFLFESIVGNCHHWDVGGGISGHIVAWRNDDTDQQIGLYCDAHVGHLCTSIQKRSFDLTANGNGSRYMLLEQLDGPSTSLFLNGVAPANQYNGKLIPAINRTTFDAKISMAAQADIVFKLAYQRGGFESDIGYNFFAHSKEKLHSRGSLVNNRFAIKGDAQIYGFGPNTTVPANIPVALNATQSKATLNAGQAPGNANFANLNADNAAAATTTGGVVLTQLNLVDSTALGIPQVQVQGSNPAILLQDSDINESSALLPRALSNKFFLYCNYVWDQDETIAPYCGIGAAVEVANTNPDHNSAFSQWLVWAKAGIAY